MAVVITRKCGCVPNKCSCGGSTISASSVDYISELQGNIPDPDNVASEQYVQLAIEGITVDVQGKADKVDPVVDGNLAGLDVDGNLTDSGYAPSDFATSTDLDDKQDKDLDAVVGNLAVFDAGGNAVDAGYSTSLARAFGDVPRFDAGTGIVKTNKIDAYVDTGGAVEAVSGDSAAVTAVSFDGDYIALFKGPGDKSAIARTTGALVFLGDDAPTNRAAQRTELGATTVGGALFTAATVDTARGVLSLNEYNDPPIIRDCNTFVFTAVDVTGSAAASVSTGTRFDLQTGTTANSSLRYRPTENSPIMGKYTSGYNWSRAVQIVSAVHITTANAESVYTATFGKATTAAAGAPASGNYVGWRIENDTITALYACAGSAVETVVVSVALGSYGQIVITANNGTVEWRHNNVLIGSTASGPTFASSTGTPANFEINNGATAATYRVVSRHEIWSY